MGWCQVGSVCRPFPKSGGRILEDTGGPWGHQVAVMIQIVSALALEVPAFLQNIEKLQGVSPNVQLSCEPWGHADHIGGDCGCLSSDSTGAYAHGLSLIPREGSPVPGLEDPSTTTWESCARISAICVSTTRRLYNYYGRLLLAVYVRWKTGLLVTSDWLHDPVTRGGGGGLEGGPTSHRALCG